MSSEKIICLVCAISVQSRFTSEVMVSSHEDRWPEPPMTFAM